jgi:nucleoredoxin
MQVASIPNLVVVERATGKVVTTAGRDAVDADPQGEKFPWVPPTVAELTQGPVHTASGEHSDFATVSRGKVTGIYFSAHWCPPCRAFTPHLIDFYKRFKGTSQEFEIVFASRCVTAMACDRIV